jgi:glucose dehydrogenase
MRVTPGIIFTAGMVALVYSLVVPQGYSQVVPQKGDWPAYRRDPGGAGYSPLAQIDVANVNRLERAWTYHTGETGRSFEATPIFVNNVL